MRGRLKIVLFLAIIPILCNGDSLHNNKKVSLTTPTGGSAKNTVSTLEENESSAAKIYPKEEEDLKNIQGLNKPITMGYLKQQHDIKKSVLLLSNGNKLKAKSAEVNILSAEEINVMANTNSTVD